MALIFYIKKRVIGVTNTHWDLKNAKKQEGEKLWRPVNLIGEETKINF